MGRNGKNVGDWGNVKLGIAEVMENRKKKRKES